VRTFIAIVAIVTTFSAGAQNAPTGSASGEDLLRQGLASYRNADFEDAVLHLDGAAQVFLSPDQMQNYVNTGKMANLDRLETSLIYLALANAQLQREDQARQAVLRLMTAERIAPTYATLPLEADALPFESLVPRLVAGTALPRNTRLAALPPGSGPTLVAQATPPPVPSQSLQATPPPQPDPCAAAEQLAAQLLTERENRQRTIDAVVAQERARIERAADERVAAAERAAQEKIATAQRASEQRIAEQRIPPQTTPPPPTPVTIVRSTSREYRSYLSDLRDAYALVADRQFTRANAIYNRLANLEDVPREVLAEAAVGLYQTGAYADAIRAFRRLGSFNRGDEDLRYYYAVALYETGNYADAQREIACALPYIQVTDEVSRYRTKIQSASKQALR
jgi:tetratricopeptide (TPR) repeat protein